ncbi:MAG: hypothetical protein JW781_09910 [Deltaproteobacteria bacterium]|nr:hypothetical protein [Candidatus Anaeroferrophillacea bacterium]
MTASITWNNGDSEMRDIDAGAPDSANSGADPTGFAGMNHYASLELWEGYSDLDIDQIEYALGAVYQYTDNLSFNLNASYFDYSDDEAYLYDTDGDALFVNGGLTYKF